MPDADVPESNDPDQIREVYEEFTVGSSKVGMISDPLNDEAWIQSTTTCKMDA